MGYGYYGEGEITIHPPIPVNPPDDLDPIHTALFGPDITLAGEAGSCDAITPVGDIARTLGNPEAELQRIIDTHGEGRHFDGEIVFEGEDGDTGTLAVVDGKAVLTWDEN